MADDLRIGLVALVLMTPLLLSGRFLSNESTKPTKDDLRFEDGDRIPLFSNKVYSRSDPSDKGYPYFDLPFCPPGEPINNRKKSLTEILSGGCFTNTQYQLRFKMENFDKLLCEKTLTRAKVAKFRDAIKGEFEYEMAFSGRLLQGMMGRVDDTDESRPRYYLVTHLRFYPSYTGNQVKRLIVTEDFDSAVDITEDVEIKVKFTYSVLWVEVRMRHDTSAFLPAQSWNSILSLMFWPSAVFFLFGLLLRLLLAPYFTANFTRYYHQSIESARAVNHSRPIHDNNCSCPPYFFLTWCLPWNWNSAIDHGFHSLYFGI